MAKPLDRSENVMDKRKDRWANGWQRHEDAALLEAISATNNRAMKAYVMFRKMTGSERTFRAFENRRRLLEAKQRQMQVEYNVPKGWGMYA